MIKSLKKYFISTRLVRRVCRRGLFRKRNGYIGGAYKPCRLIHVNPLLIISYVALINALVISYGFYNRMAFLFVAVSFGLLIAAAKGWYKREKLKVGMSAENMLLVALCFSVLSWLVMPIADLYPAPEAWYQQLSQKVSLVAVITIFIAYGLIPRRVFYRSILFLIMASLPIMLWFLVPRAVPNPTIDIFVCNQRAASYVVDGINPYAAETTTWQTNMDTTGYTYPPINLYPFALSYLLLGDVRYGSAALLTVTACLLWLVSRRTMNAVSSEIITLLFLYHPREILIVGGSFSEVVIVFLFVLFTLLSVYKLLPAVRAVVYGLFLSTKPYLALLILPWCMTEKKIHRIVYVVLGALLPIIPFLSSGLYETIYNGFFYILHKAMFRTDSLSTSTLLLEFCPNCKIPWIGLSLPAGLLAVVITGWFFRKRNDFPSFIYIVVITMFSIFFLGSLGLIGYYYLVSVMLLVLIAVSVKESRRYISHP